MAVADYLGPPSLFDLMGQQVTQAWTPQQLGNVLPDYLLEETYAACGKVSTLWCDTKRQHDWNCCGLLVILYIQLWGMGYGVGLVLLILNTLALIVSIRAGMMYVDEGACCHACLAGCPCGI